MIQTAAGLPNTCSQCGRDPGPVWYAKNTDQARSGGGLCQKCAYPPGDLSEIKGIGPARKAQLMIHGIRSQGDLKAADAEYLAALLDAPIDTIQGWQEQTKK